MTGNPSSLLRRAGRFTIVLEFLRGIQQIVDVGHRLLAPLVVLDTTHDQADIANPRGQGNLGGLERGDQ